MKHFSNSQKRQGFFLVALLGFLAGTGFYESTVFAQSFSEEAPQAFFKSKTPQALDSTWELEEEWRLGHLLLVPVDRGALAPNPEAELALKNAIVRSMESSFTDTAPLEEFLQKFPNAPHRSVVLGHLGLLHAKEGRFSKALSEIEEARRLAIDNGQLSVVDKLTGEVATLYAALGKKDELQRLSKDPGPAIDTSVNKLASAWETLNAMIDEPESTFTCGIEALAALSRTLNGKVSEELLQSKATREGLSLEDLRSLGGLSQINLTIVYQKELKNLTAPFIVHLRSGHYATVTSFDDKTDAYAVTMPSFPEINFMGRSALEEEMSGYFIIPSGQADLFSREVPASEASQVFGKGRTHGRNHNAHGADNEEGCSGQPFFRLNPYLGTLSMMDNPLSYDTAAGKSLQFLINYSEASDLKGPVGLKWRHSFEAYGYASNVMVSPGMMRESVLISPREGGLQPYQASQLCTLREPCRLSPMEKEDESYILRFNRAYAPGGAPIPLRMERHFADGKIEVYEEELAFGSKLHIVEERDTIGNRLTFHYDSYGRLWYVSSDPAGNETSNRYLFFSYGSDLANRAPMIQGQFFCTPDELTTIRDCLIRARDLQESQNRLLIHAGSAPYGTFRLNYADAILGTQQSYPDAERFVQIFEIDHRVQFNPGEPLHPISTWVIEPQLLGDNYWIFNQARLPRPRLVSVTDAVNLTSSFKYACGFPNVRDNEPDLGPGGSYRLQSDGTHLNDPSRCIVTFQPNPQPLTGSASEWVEGVRDPSFITWLQTPGNVVTRFYSGTWHSYRDYVGAGRDLDSNLFVDRVATWSEDPLHQKTAVLSSLSKIGGSEDVIAATEVTERPLTPVANRLADGRSFNIGFRGSDLEYRNSFSISPKAWEDGARDRPWLGKVNHYLHQGEITSPILESVRPPLESRVFFIYQNQAEESYDRSRTLAQEIKISPWPTHVVRPLNRAATEISHEEIKYRADGALLETISNSGARQRITYVSGDPVHQNDPQSIDISPDGRTWSSIATYHYTFGIRPGLADSISFPQTTHYLTYTPNGQMRTLRIMDTTSGTEELRETKTMTYDRFGMPETLTDNSGTTTLSYDSSGRITGQSLTGVFGEQVSTRYRGLDNFNRPRFIDYDNGGSRIETTEMTYDRLNVGSMYDPNRGLTRIVWDDLGRPSLKYKPAGGITKLEYCGCGQIKTIISDYQQYDESSNRANTTTFTYDRAGRLQTKTEPDGRTLSIRYDVTGRREHMEWRNGAEVRPTDYTYDTSGNLLTMTTAAGRVINYRYDTFGRVIRQFLGSEMTPEELTVYTYARLPRMDVISIDGPLADDTITFGQDSSARRIAENFARTLGSSGPIPGDSSWSLPDGQGSRAYWTLNGPFQIESVVDTVPESTSSRRDYTWTPTYRGPFGTVSEMQMPNGAQYGTLFHRGGETHEQYRPFLTHYTNAAGEELYGEQIGYRPAGEISSIAKSIDDLPADNEGFLYDRSGRLEHHDHTSTEGSRARTTYVYDRKDNRHAVLVNDESQQSLRFLNGNKIQDVSDASGSHSITYNGFGEITSDHRGHFYEWDGEGRLRFIRYGSATTNARSQFGYDLKGRLTVVMEYDANNRLESFRRFVWVGDLIAQERDFNGNVVRRFFENMVVDPNRSLTTSTGVTPSMTYVRDHQGSVVGLLNERAELIATQSFDAYGQRTSRTGEGWESVPFGYSGYFIHDRSGLNVTWARFYDPTLGRWLNKDPIGEAGGENLYAYVGGDPVNQTDPLGLSSASQLARFLPGINIFALGIQHRSDGIFMMGNEATMATGLCLMRRGIREIGIGGQVTGITAAIVTVVASSIISPGANSAMSSQFVHIEGQGSVIFNRIGIVRLSRSGDYRVATAFRGIGGWGWDHMELAAYMAHPERWGALQAGDIELGFIFLDETIVGFPYMTSTGAEMFSHHILNLWVAIKDALPYVTEMKYFLNAAPGEMVKWIGLGM